jgi:sugar phosphate permease
LWVLLAVKPAGLPAGVLQVAMFWGGFFASTWIPAYAQLKEAVPPRVVATAMGMLNLFFWLGGAFYQQISGLILESFPERGGHIALAGYRTVFYVCLGSVALSVILAVCSKEQRRRDP